MSVTAREVGESVVDQPFLRSTLVLGRGSWRQFVREGASLLWCALATAGAWLSWWQLRHSSGILVIALIVTAWCLYVGRSWVAALRWRRRILTSGEPTLQLDARGIWMRHPFGPSGGAFLHWVDCVAVVVSAMPTAGRTPESYRGYVQFVPASPDRVEGTPHPQDQRTDLVQRPPVEVLTVWMELTGVGHSTADVAGWVRRWRPEVRLLESANRRTPAV